MEDVASVDAMAGRYGGHRRSAASLNSQWILYRGHRLLRLGAPRPLLSAMRSEAGLAASGIRAWTPGRSSPAPVCSVSSTSSSAQERRAGGRLPGAIARAGVTSRPGLPAPESYRLSLKDWLSINQALLGELWRDWQPDNILGVTLVSAPLADNSLMALRRPTMGGRGSMFANFFAVVRTG